MTVVVHPYVRTLFGTQVGKPITHHRASQYHEDPDTRTLRLTNDRDPSVLASYARDEWARAEVIDTDERTQVERLAEWMVEVGALPQMGETWADTVIRLLTPVTTVGPADASSDDTPVEVPRLIREASALAHMVTAALDATPSGRLWQPAGAPADMDAAAPGLVVSDGNVDALRNLAGFVIETIGDPPAPTPSDTPGPACYPPVEVVRPAQSFDPPPPAETADPGDLHEALHAIDLLIGNRPTLDEPTLGAVRGIVLDSLSADHQARNNADPDTAGLPGVQGLDDVDRVLDTTDARVWAQAFTQARSRRPYLVSDEGFLIGWFANAIETGRTAGRRQTETPAPVGDLAGLAEGQRDPAAMRIARAIAGGDDVLDMYLDDLAPEGTSAAFRVALRAASRVANLADLLERIEDLSGMSGEVRRINQVLDSTSRDLHLTGRALDAEQRITADLRSQVDRPTLRVGSAVSVEDDDGAGVTGVVLSWTAAPGGPPFVILGG